MNMPTKPTHPVFRQPKVAASAARALLLLLLCPVVLAQQVTPAPTENPSNKNKKDDVVTLEAFAVTGSNIKRIEQEKTQPLTTLRAEQFEVINPGQPSDMFEKLPMVIAANALIAAECRKDQRLGYADVYTPMLDAKGGVRPELFVQDMLHMNEAGYAMWTRVLAPLLR